MSVHAWARAHAPAYMCFVFFKCGHVPSCVIPTPTDVTDQCTVNNALVCECDHLLLIVISVCVFV